MPTVGRLVSAVLMAALIWYVSELYKPLLPEGRDPKLLSEINALIAFVVGWSFWGTRSGHGMVTAIGYGITMGALSVFWCLFLQCFGEMIRLSLRKQYDGPMEAVVGVFALMIEFGEPLLNAPILTALAVGSILTGVLAETLGRRYT